MLCCGITVFGKLYYPRYSWKAVMRIYKLFRSLIYCWLSLTFSRSFHQRALTGREYFPQQQLRMLEKSCSYQRSRTPLWSCRVVWGISTLDLDNLPGLFRIFSSFCFVRQHDGLLWILWPFGAARNCRKMIAIFLHCFN